MDNWRLVKIGTTQGQRKLFFKLKKEKQKLVEQGFAPETKLLSSRLGVSEQEVRDMDLRLDGWDVSLDEPLKDDSDTERGDFFSSDTESIESQVARKEVQSLLREKLGDFKKQLSERELDIFQRRIFTGTPDTLQDIGDKYQISRERVRQLEKNIVKKMRVFFEKEIPDFAAYEHPEEND
jgi:RNA polymerase sigma-32 factor